MEIGESIPEDWENIVLHTHYSRGPLMQESNQSIKDNMQAVFMTVMRSVVLYGIETWACSDRQNMDDLLKSCDRRMLRYIYKA